MIFESDYDKKDICNWPFLQDNRNVSKLKKYKSEQV